MKADQWRSLIQVLFIGLFVAWEVNGEIPDDDAPASAANTKNSAAQVRLEKLLRDRRLACLLADNPNPSDDDINEAKNATMSRSYQVHYDTVVQFSAAIRTLTSRSISPNDVKHGCAALARSCQSFARMGCHLTPYFHLAQHMESQFYELGPCYGWWVFAYERNNGWLARTRHNGHSGGELEGTMMRRWWKARFIQDLVGSQIHHLRSQS